MKNTYLITDPCYLTNNEQWQELGEKYEWQLQDIEEPTVVKDDEGNLFTLLKIEGTPNGDGSCKYNGSRVAVDSGLLCVAIPHDQKKTNYAHGFLTTGELEQAESHLENILQYF